MAIAPIDLQTLYSQLENVSKSVAYQQQGIHLSNAIQQDKIARQQAEKNTSVQQVKKDNEDNISVKDRKSFQNEQNPSDKKNSKNESEEEDNPQTYRFKDPNLGKYIDISG